MGVAGASMSSGLAAMNDKAAAIPFAKAAGQPWFYRCRPDR